MKSLCIGFLGADWWGSDARAMAAELRRRGHLVMERNYEDHLPTKWRHPLLKVVRRILRGLMSRDYNRSVAELLDVQGMDFLLVFKGMLLDPGTLARFKVKGIPCYCFYPDVSFHDHGRNIPACLPLYDCVFTSKSYHIKDPWVLERARKLVFAPHGFDPKVHRPVFVGSGAESPYACDASFLGMWSPKKEGILRGLCRAMPQLNLRIWGGGWQRACRELRVRWEGRGAFGDEASAVYGASRINLGLLSEAGTGMASGDKTTARTFQIPAAGGFMMHEDSAEAREVFRDGEEAVFFSSVEDLVAKVESYLPDEAARRRIAAAGRDAVLRVPCTYRRAVDMILSHHAGRDADPAAARTMRAAYVGALGGGSTSAMRAEALKQLTPGWDWEWIDTDQAMREAPRWAQTLAFRLRIGPVVRRVDHLVAASTGGGNYDLIWVDKSVLLRRRAMAAMRRAAVRLVHFTPDAAFHANRSRFFRRHIGHYDLLATTKSFEMDEYLQRVAPRKLFLTTQGYDPVLHHPAEPPVPRQREAAFIGLAEPDREHCLAALLEAGVAVRLGGIGWERFLARWKDHPGLRFLGSGLFGEDYAQVYREAWVGLGLMTKRFGELHTTRTFEIPACGAILATERNPDTEGFFHQGEALFFDDHHSLAKELRRLFDSAGDHELAGLAEAGRRRVVTGGRDYRSVLRGVLAAAGVFSGKST
jgi:hypothetical protein